MPYIQEPTTSFHLDATHDFATDVCTGCEYTTNPVAHTLSVASVNPYGFLAHFPTLDARTLQAIRRDPSLQNEDGSKGVQLELAEWFLVVRDPPNHEIRDQWECEVASDELASIAERFLVYEREAAGDYDESQYRQEKSTASGNGEAYARFALMRLIDDVMHGEEAERYKAALDQAMTELKSSEGDIERTSVSGPGFIINSIISRVAERSKSTQQRLTAQSTTV